MSVIKLLTLAALLVLPACSAVGPDYSPPTTPMPDRWQSAAPGASVAPDTRLARWWTLFGDPVLDRLVDKALAGNKDLAMAETRIREAMAERRATAAAGRPGIGTSAGYTTNRTGQYTSSGKSDNNLLQAGFDFSWELDVFGGIRRAEEAADAAVGAGVEDKRDIQVLIVAEVARNYLELRGNERRLAITKESIDLQQQTVAMVKERLRVGFGSSLEVVQAENQLALTSSQVPVLQAAIDRARHQLALLLGQRPETLIPELCSTEPIPTLPPHLPIVLPSELLRQRPDIRRAERQLAAATAEVGVATADLFPRFSLTALIGLESVSISKVVTSGSRYWSAGPKLSWNLLDGGRTRAGIAAADSRLDRARLNYEKTVLTALAETEDALTSFSREKESLDRLRTAVDTGRQAVEIAKQQFSIGLVDFLNVLQSERAFYQSQDLLVQSRQRLGVDMVALYKALGGGWWPAEEKLSAVPFP